MAYLRKTTSLPVPTVLDWSDDAQNPLKTEYIIMEHVDGVQLRQQWETMNPLTHLLCVESLAKLLKELNLLQFPAYGSIYFDSAPVHDSQRVPLSDGFFIGPSLAHRYWPECGPGLDRWYQRRRPNRGPWTSFEAFTESLVDIGVSHFPPETVPGTLDHYGSVQENLELLDALDKATAELSKDQRLLDVSEPRLFHNDLHMRNIFVSRADPAQITGLIDWQSATLDPIFLYAHMTPDLCTHPQSAQDLLQGEDDEQSGNMDAKKRKKAGTDDVDRCRQAWELLLIISAPKLHKARALDEALLRPFRQCYSTW